MSGALPLTLKGTIEADETYIGGKPRNITPKAKIKGMPKTDKTPVLAIIERNGNALSKPIPNITMDTLQGSIRAVVDHDSTIITDEFPSYYGVGYDFSGGHKVVNHRRREYVRGDIYTNTGESYFALLKRGVHGTFHHISVKHLSRYCNEFSFRWDNRKIDDGNRTVAAVRGMVGKRLKYKALTKQAA
jgi:transposase-like protein